MWTVGLPHAAAAEVAGSTSSCSRSGCVNIRCWQVLANHHAGWGTLIASFQQQQHRQKQQLNSCHGVLSSSDQQQCFDCGEYTTGVALLGRGPEWLQQLLAYACCCTGTAVFFSCTLMTL